MLNQLFNGKGDTMTLAQGRERIVPANSTYILVAVEQ